MNIQRIRYFIAVQKERSFSRAAERCYISQPSLSNQIKKLEDEVGGILFHRAHTGVELSDLGKAFFPHAQAIMTEVEAAQEFYARSSDTLHRPVRIGAIPTIAPYLLPQLIAFIKQHHPQAEFAITENTTEVQLQALENREVDFVLLSPPTKMDERLSHIKLFDDELLVTLPNGHSLNANDVIPLSALQKEPLVLLEDAHCLSKQSKSYCQTTGLNVNITIRSAQIETLLAMVEQGMGFTFTPRMAIPMHRHRQLTFHPINPKPYYREIRLVWNPNMSVSQTHNLLLGLLKNWRPDH